MSSSTITYIDDIDWLLDRYRYFLVDQFGVLHNGESAYSGSVEALRSIRRGGGHVTIISNSGKRASSNIQRLQRLGFGQECFDELVTSGEVAWNLLKHQLIGQRFDSGASCYYLSNDNDRSAVEGLGLVEADSVDCAQLVFLAGQHLLEAGLAALCDSLVIAIDRGIPCVCTNPDKMAFAEKGRKVFSSGAVAAWYEAQGGEVIWIGKPYPQIYKHILASQNVQDPDSVVCIGDSIEHDIVGGASQGLATALVRTGINDHCGATELEALFQQHKVWPQFILPAFSGRN